MIETPVLFLIFNRPEQTQRVFDIIRQVQPKKLFIAADGPRYNNKIDLDRCAQVRSIVSTIDWPCEVQKNFREKNLGCKYAVSSAINWFFENVEEGIILEDDTLPEPSFFSFCEQLLSEYKDNERVMHITGTNFQFGRKRGDASYYFSRYPHIWGWASWRRAWQHYDLEMEQFEDFIKNNRIDTIVQSKEEKSYWLNIFTSVYNKQIDTWDYQWRYSIWNRDGVVIVPNVNLISNIGYGDDSTHTYQNDSPTANLQTGKIEQITHPKEKAIQVHKKADYYAYTISYNTRVTWLNRIRNFSYKFLPTFIVTFARKVRRSFISDKSSITS
jgi:hypothetical protein